MKYFKTLELTTWLVQMDDPPDEWKDFCLCANEEDAYINWLRCYVEKDNSDEFDVIKTREFRIVKRVVTEYACIGNKSLTFTKHEEVEHG